MDCGNDCFDDGGRVGFVVWGAKIRFAGGRGDVVWSGGRSAESME